MQWTPGKIAILELYWQDETDKELGVRLGTTAKAIKHKRMIYGLDRRGSEYCKEWFVVQVTDWLGRNDMDYWSEYLRTKDVEHIIATLDSKYAVFRAKIGSVPTVQEPPQSAWVLHWKPK